MDSKTGVSGSSGHRVLDSLRWSREDRFLLVSPNWGLHHWACLSLFWSRSPLRLGVGCLDVPTRYPSASDPGPSTTRSGVDSFGSEAQLTPYTYQRARAVRKSAWRRGPGESAFGEARLTAGDHGLMRDVWPDGDTRSAHSKVGSYTGPCCRSWRRFVMRSSKAPKSAGLTDAYVWVSMPSRSPSRTSPRARCRRGA